MKRPVILATVIGMILLLLAPACVQANEEGRANTVKLLAGLTGLAVYEQNGYAIAATALGTIYAAKRYNDDVKNNRREARQQAARYSGGYYYNGSQSSPQQVVPASYSNSCSQHLSYKGFNYGSSESHSASFRPPPQPPRNQSPQVVYIIVQNGQNAPSAPYPQPQQCNTSCNGSNCAYTENSARNSGKGYDPRPTYSAVYTAPTYTQPAKPQLIPVNYSNSRSEHISYGRGSFSYSEHNSASFRPVQQAPSYSQPPVVYYMNR